MVFEMAKKTSNQAAKVQNDSLKEGVIDIEEIHLGDLLNNKKIGTIWVYNDAKNAHFVSNKDLTEDKTFKPFSDLELLDWSDEQLKKLSNESIGQVSNVELLDRFVGLGMKNALTPTQLSLLKDVYNKRVIIGKEEFRNLTEEENECLTNDSDSLNLDEELGIDWNDVEEVSDNDRQFSLELFKFISELVPEEDLNESFRSHESLVKHFNKHCLCGDNSKKSKKTNVLYDFSTLEQYDNYEREISSGLASGKNVIVVNDLTKKEFIEKSFRKFFEGNMYIYFSPLCGFNNRGKSISILFHAYSTSHTSDYKSNTVDMNVRIGETTLTLYPLDSFYLESKLNNIIKKCSPVSIELKINNENLNESSEESELSFDDFLSKAEVILVDDAKSFSINDWEDELSKEIEEEWRAWRIRNGF